MQMLSLQQVAATKRLRPAAVQRVAELAAVRDDVARTSSKETADRHSDRIEAILQLKADTEVTLFYYCISTNLAQSNLFYKFSVSALYSYRRLDQRIAAAYDTHCM